jgi:hypothetical protein
MKYIIIIASLIALCSARGARVNKGECVFRNDPIISDKNCFRMVVQDDGNMVIYRQSDSKVAWSTETHRKGGYKACMQGKKFCISL